MTTVEVSKQNWRRLHNHRDPSETMDDVIGEALDAYEATHESAHETTAE